MSGFASFADFDAWLDSLGMFHMELGLGRIKKILAFLDLLKPPFPIIQVLGTNGKGSCASFLSSLGIAHGLKTGLFTSPHFVSIEERIKIDNKPVARDIWLESADRILAAADSLKENLTYFEFLTALALMIFNSQKTELAIFEAGLGGKNDSTSAIPTAIHCFGPMAMDHAKVIGPSLAHIARDKAAAIQPGALVFAAPQSPPAQKILIDACSAKNSPLEFIPADRRLKPRLPGENQIGNASLALAAWRAFARRHGAKSSPDLEKAAIASAFIPGRLQKIPRSGNLPAIILDGAHNPHAVQTLLKNLGAKKPRAVIFSALSDKDWQTSLALIDRRVGPAPMLIPDLNNSRAASPEEIAQKRAWPETAFCFHGQASFAKALAAAADIARGEEEYVLIAGSLYLAANFFKLYPQYLEPAV